MGNVFWQSCCPKNASLHIVDKVVNLVIGSSLRLSEVTVTDLGSLERSREASQKFNQRYEKLVSTKWQVTSKQLERLQGQGPKIEVVFHRPKGSSREDLPLIIWAHGGAMVLGSCRDAYAGSFMLALEEKFGEFCWASVEYRLAPEHKFPAAVDDFVSAYKSFAREDLAREFGYSLERLKIGGVSAGALVACHAGLRLARLAQAPPMALLYPMVSPSCSSASHERFGSLPGLPTSFLRASWDWLLSDAQGHVSTELQDSADLLRCDFPSLKGIPVLVCLSSYDCMHDEGEALAKRLSQSGAVLYQVEGRGSHAMAHIVDPECKAKTFESFGVILK